MIYKAIKVLDTIDKVKKHGIKNQARVINIREETDSKNDDYASSTTYYYTVNFNDKNGRNIEKEIEFGIDKRPTRNPPFSIGIIYYIDENKNIDIIIGNSKKTILSGYFLLLVGLFFLSMLIYNYNGEIDKILEFINNLFK
tara:strand:+ start:240 stop:662 length:423 start_codon:yes stop_codon:yes gene_type:complete